MQSKQVFIDVDDWKSIMERRPEKGLEEKIRIWKERIDSKITADSQDEETKLKDKGVEIELFVIDSLVT